MIDEWFDRCDRGTPFQLRCDPIPLPSQIIPVADTVAALRCLLDREGEDFIRPSQPFETHAFLEA